MDAVLEKANTRATIVYEKPPTNGEPKTIRWTREQYYRMAELGFFEGRRVELIKGEIIEMSPMKSAHATAVRLVVEMLRKVFASGFIVDSQLPMSFGKTDEPEPDVAVVKGEVRDFAHAHPKNAILLLEVSDTTLHYDRTKKASLYAENKIADYWILNLKNRCLEIYREPKRDKKIGFVFTEIKIITEDETIAPLAAPDSKIKVADLLP